MSRYRAVKLTEISFKLEDDWEIHFHYINFQLCRIFASSHHSVHLVDVLEVAEDIIL